MENRQIGFYWVKYPEIQWQIAHWNGEFWYICGSTVNIPKVREIGEYVGRAERRRNTNNI